MTVQDITDKLKAVQWTGWVGADRRLASKVMRDIKAGLYVHYMHNNHALPVFDRNGESRGRGKLLMNRGLGAIKIGKFEDGLFARRSLDAKHYVCFRQRCVIGQCGPIRLRSGASARL